MMLEWKYGYENAQSKRFILLLELTITSFIYRQV
jgi:hypothetical protein